MLVTLASSTLNTKYGEYRETLFYDGQHEYIAMTLGEVENREDVPCRIHSSCIFGHYFNSIECDCREQMELAQQLIQQEGCGVIILLDQEGKGNGHLALMKSIAFKRQGMNQADAYEAAGFSRDARDFRRAADILKALGVRSIRLISDSPDKKETLIRNGIPVSAVLTAGPGH